MNMRLFNILYYCVSAHNTKGQALHYKFQAALDANEPHSRGGLERMTTYLVLLDVNYGR